MSGQVSHPFNDGLPLPLHKYRRSTVCASRSRHRALPGPTRLLPRFSCRSARSDRGFSARLPTHQHLNTLGGIGVGNARIFPIWPDSTPSKRPLTQRKIPTLDICLRKPDTRNRIHPGRNLKLPLESGGACLLGVRHSRSHKCGTKHPEPPWV